MNGQIQNAKYINLSKVDDIQLNGVSIVDANRIVELKTIIETANDALADYYSKSETYTKNEINTLITNRVSFNIVNELPNENISASMIYLVAKNENNPGDGYDEYIRINNTWEHVGSFDADLSNYYNKTETDVLLANLSNTLNNSIDNVSEDVSVLSAQVGSIDSVLDLINGEVI